MKPIGYDALIKLYQEYLRIVSDEETISFSDFAGKFNTNKVENQESIIDLLKSINSNLIYLKRATICEHLGCERTHNGNNWLYLRCKCKTCGSGILAGEK